MCPSFCKFSNLRLVKPDISYKLILLIDNRDVPGMKPRHSMFVMLYVE